MASMAIQMIHKEQHNHRKSLAQSFRTRMNSRGMPLSLDKNLYRDQSQARRATNIRKGIPELVNYLLFLALLTTVILSTRSDAGFRHTLGIVDQLVDNTDFHSIGTLDGVYQYLETSLYPRIYGHETVFGYSRVVGQVRLGQLRVKTTSCNLALTVPDASPTTDFVTIPSTDKVDEQLVNLFNASTWMCYPALSPDTQTTTAQSWDSSGEAFTPVSSNENDDEPSYWSESGRSYPPPQYNVYLDRAEPSNCDRSNPSVSSMCRNYAALTRLRAGSFLNKGTRGFLVDLTVYNPTLDEFGIIRLVFEQTAGGNIATEAEIGTYRLPMFRSFSLSFVLYLIFLALVLVQILAELWILRREGWRTYLTMSVNVLHFFNLWFYFLTAVLKWLEYQHYPGDAVSLLRLNPDLAAFVNFRTCLWYYRMADDINSINCVFAVVKFFKFMEIIPPCAQVGRTFTRSFKPLMMFMLLFSAALFGFAMSFMLAFGTSSLRYNSLGSSCLTLIRMLLGDFDFMELVSMNRFLGPLLFLFYILIVVFVLLNMLVAITADAYKIVQDDLISENVVGLHGYGKEIRDHLLYNVLFRFPCIGACLRTPYERRYGPKESQVLPENLKEEEDEEDEEEEKPNITVVQAFDLYADDVTGSDSKIPDQFVAMIKFLEDAQAKSAKDMKKLSMMAKKVGKHFSSESRHLSAEQERRLTDSLAMVQIAGTKLAEVQDIMSHVLQKDLLTMDG